MVLVCRILNEITARLLSHSLLFNHRLLVITEAEFVEQVLLSKRLFRVNVSSAPLRLLVLLLVRDQQLLDLVVDHFFPLRLLFLHRLVVQQRCRLNRKVRPIVLKLFEQCDV